MKVDIKHLVHRKNIKCSLFNFGFETFEVTQTDGGKKWKMQGARIKRYCTSVFNINQIINLKRGLFEIILMDITIVEFK